MGKTKPRGRYQSISLSVPFIEEIKKHIMKDSRYKSVADFTREAIREKMNNNLLEKRVELLELELKNLSKG